MPPVSIRFDLILYCTTRRKKYKNNFWQKKSRALPVRDGALLHIYGKDRSFGRHSAGMIFTWSAEKEVCPITMSVILATSMACKPSAGAETTTLTLFSPM